MFNKTFRWLSTFAIILAATGYVLAATYYRAGPSQSLDIDRP